MNTEELNKIVSNIDFAIGIIKTCSSKDQSITKSRTREPEFTQIINLLEKRKRRAVKIKFGEKV